MLDQAKINLAVLWKLFQHSENGGKAEPPREIANLFTTSISLRRIEVALQTLDGRHEVENVYHPHYFDEGLWQISGGGMQTVERALKLPSSFIARLANNGDQWLETDEAKTSILSKNLRYEEPNKASESVVARLPPAAENQDSKLHVNISPVFNNSSGASGDHHQVSANRASWFAAWGGWASVAIALAGFLWVLHQAKVF